MTHLAEVVTLYETNLNDVPAKLRDLADQIESGVHGENVSLALVISSEFGIDVRGLGRMDALQAIATLNLGLAQLTHTTLANMAEDE